MATRVVLLGPRLGVLVCGLCGFLIGILAFVSYQSVATKKNSLATGKFARIKGAVEIPYYRPSALNGKSKDSVLASRIRQVKQYRTLVSGRYSPSEKVFSAIESNAPWLGIKGFYLPSHKNEITAGESYESRFINNPFELLGVEFWGINGLKRSRFKWDLGKIEPNLEGEGSFQFFCNPEKLEWNPSRSILGANYKVREHLLRINQYARRPAYTSDVEFGIVSYNAVDFGYSHILLDLENSKGIDLRYPTANPIELGDRIIKSRICALSEGCYYHKNSTSNYDYIRVKSFPAVARFKLWREKPASLNQAADTSVVLSFD